MSAQERAAPADSRNCRETPDFGRRSRLPRPKKDVIGPAKQMRFGASRQAGVHRFAKPNRCGTTNQPEFIGMRMIFGENSEKPRFAGDTQIGFSFYDT